MFIVKEGKNKMYKKFIKEIIKKELFERRYSAVKFESFELPTDTMVHFEAKCINLANDKAEYECIDGYYSVYNGFDIKTVA